MLQQTAKSCGPDAPTLASSSRMVNRPYRAQMSHTSADDGGKRARSPGRARSKPLKRLRAGMPGDSSVLVYSCAFLPMQSAHEAAGATGTRRSPRPLFSKGETTATLRTLSVARPKVVSGIKGTSLRGALATKQSILCLRGEMDCFVAEPVIGRACARPVGSSQ